MDLITCSRRIAWKPTAYEEINGRITLEFTWNLQIQQKCRDTLGIHMNLATCTRRAAHTVGINIRRAPSTGRITRKPSRNSHGCSGIFMDHVIRMVYEFVGIHTESATARAP